MSLKGRVAVVTGAGKGVGKALSRRLLSEGVTVIAVSRNVEDLNELENETKEIQDSAESKLIPLSGDVSIEETAEEAVHMIKEQFGKVDILVNNAGIGKYGLLDDLSIEDYDLMMNSNMRSTFLFTKAVLPFMKEHQYGHIVNVASVAGKKGLPNETIYCATKFAQVGFAQALDHEVRPFGIKVSSICPGGINTNFAIGTGRTLNDPALEEFLDAEDVVKAILFILEQSPKSRIIELFMRPISEPL
ncbi:SDR family oxidoreductase [Neobacillus vireti]|uniref:Short chain dehydrogenase/reductase family oxidoreductase n=1 Tax=Neobacillus vireti LMG 21834 TaxID=1131730 RepID=A0AB94IJV5_9BACI|nr:SDR family oxidoreductase [Neobacillus vireti]ETI67304.1 short chain dehydrogenase/reductase family oxidoreductase [Neobacillus vireti LMG 21834]KLT18029.1 short-chain dehydrogenase [Neobacillus vireti]